MNELERRMREALSDLRAEEARRARDYQKAHPLLLPNSKPIKVTIKQNAT